MEGTRPANEVVAVKRIDGGRGLCGGGREKS